MQIGKKIKRIRELKGYTQQEVAEKMSLSQRAYSNLENDQTKIDFQRLEVIANIFEIDPIELLTFDEKQIFNNSPQSGNYNSYSAIKNNTIDVFENERNAYLKQIEHLQEEISFLRKLIDK